MDEIAFNHWETEKNNMVIPKLLVPRLFFLVQGKTRFYKIKNH